MVNSAGGEDRPAGGATGASAEGAADPVRASRARWARWAAAGKRVGYSLVLVAIVAFAVGAATGFSGFVTGTVTACLLGSTVTLAPGLVIGYGVKKAEREDPLPRRR